MQEISIDEITPYPQNNRTHPAQQIQRIADSIKEFGFNQPIVIDESNVVLVGHGRLLAAQKLGLKKVPIERVAKLSEAQKRAYRILDNKLQNDSDWDFAALEYEIAALKGADFDLEKWGLDELLPEPEIEVTEDGGPGELPDQPYIKLGDLIELGDHRLLCGDATSAEAAASVTLGKLADLVFIDPPYNIGGNLKTGYQGTTAEKAQGQLRSCGWDNDFDPRKALAAIHPLMAPASSIYVCMSHFTAPAIWEFMREAFDFYGFCVWCKTNPMPSLHKRHWTFGVELIAYATQGDHKFNFPADTHALNWWDVKNERHSTDHPTQKPVAIPARAIKHSSAPGDLVLDFFLGSGTTLIACEKLDRICYGMEIDPAYCQVIIERYQNHCKESGKDFVCRINGEDFDGGA